MKFYPLVQVFLHLESETIYEIFQLDFENVTKNLFHDCLLICFFFFQGKKRISKNPVPVQIIRSRRSQRRTRRLKRLSSRDVSCWARTVFCRRTPCWVDSPTPQDTACLHMSNGQGWIAPLIIYTIREAQVSLAPTLDWNLCWQDGRWLMLCQ